MTEVLGVSWNNLGSLKACNMVDSPTVPERYATAATTSDLSVSLERRTDADVLMAAGMSAGKDRRAALAMSVYRAGVTGDHSGLLPMANELADWLSNRLAKERRKPMRRTDRVSLALAVMQHWFNPVCGHCEGRGFLLMDGAPVLSSHECPHCGGTGRRKLSDSIGNDHAELGKWLSGELDRLVSLVHAEMARKLSRKMDL